MLGIKNKEDKKQSTHDCVVFCILFTAFLSIDVCFLGEKIIWATAVSQELKLKKIKTQ